MRHQVQGNRHLGSGFQIRLAGHLRLSCSQQRKLITSVQEAVATV
jgi:hypothetical protein